MDSALLREREAFKRKAMAVPVVESSASKREKLSGSSAADKKAAKASAVGGGLSKSAKNKSDIQQMKSSMAPGVSSLRFGVLAKIVRHMKTRHMEGDDHPLTLDEILDETSQMDIGSRTKAWLMTEALKNNPKISVENDGKYIYKAPYPVTNKKSLLKLLRQYDLKGLGGIFLEDLQESLPKCDNVIRKLLDDEKIVVLSRTVDRKKIVFYHDHTVDMDVDEEFRKLWRSVAVEGTDDDKIKEYLEKQGIRSMADNGTKKVFNHPKRRKGNFKRKTKAPKDNDHMKDILEDYNEMTASHHTK